MGPELRWYRANRDLSQCGVTKGEVFCSRWYRGLKPGMEWLRLTLEGSGPLQVRVYAADLPEGPFAPAAGEPVLQRTARDLSLYGIKGQYLSFTAEPVGALKSYALYFPGRSIAEGLPAILQEDEGLRRVLAVCQSGYMDLNRQISRFPERMDPRSPDALPHLERWIGAGRWAVDQTTLRRILPRGADLGRMRGTRRGLDLLAQLVTGHSPRILERPGQSPAVIVLLPDKVSSADLERLRNLMPDFIPAGVNWQLTRLEEGGPLDGYTYLEENTVLEGEPSCTLQEGPDGDAMILE